MKYYNCVQTKRFTPGQFIIGLVSLFFGITVIAYAAVTVPNSFSSGATISSGQVNANFTALGNAMPAVKQSTPTSSLQLSGTIANVTSITVTPPVAGYIVLTGSGTVEIDPVTAGAMQARVHLSATSGGTSTTDYAWFGYGTTAGVGGYVLHPFSVTRIFPVTAGAAQTFYMTGQETVGATTHTTFVSQATLTAVFVPSLLP